ncbi:MAG: IS5 family transposase [Thermoplasmatota archaeon]
MSFNRFILEEQYKKVKGLGDRLELMKHQIDWRPFVPLVKSVFHDNKETGGRPHTDELVVVRSMLLQGWYNLSDQELEFQCYDRLSFRNFLGFPEKIPDFTTIWKIRDRLEETGIDTFIMAELQKQLDEKGLKVEKGMIQDAAFIEADLGKKRYRKEKNAKKKGETITYTEKQRQHMDKDGSFSVKHGQVHYGYKSHIKMDIDHHLVRDITVTTASVHDSKIDLATPQDVIYRDRGYTGKETKAKGNGSMKRGNLTPHEKLRNKRISKKRAPGERPFSVVKRVFHGERTQVKTLGRVRVKETFKYFAYDLYQLVTLERKRLAVAR